MSFSQIADDLYFAIFETSESLKGAVINPDIDGILENIRIPIYVNGTPSGTEQIRIKLHSSDRYSSAFATSDWSSISDITSLSTYWVGLLRFDFNRIPIDKDITAIYTEIETTGYTRNADTFYIGAMLEWPEITNSYDPEDGCPIKQEWYWLRDNGYS